MRTAAPYPRPGRRPATRLQRRHRCSTNGRPTVGEPGKHTFSTQHIAAPDSAPPNGHAAYDAALTNRPPRLADRLLTAAQLASIPRPRPLVGELLPAAALAVVWGKPGSAKSFLALDLALCVAGGLPWQGQEIRQGKVLYVAAEGAAGLQLRVAAWEQEFRTTAPDGIRFHQGRINLLDGG